MNRAATGVLVLCALCQQQAHAASVRIDVTTQSGAPSDYPAVIVFDPLDTAPPPAHGKEIIDQISKRFVPTVSVIRTGTAVSFPNKDKIHHEVYSFSAPHRFILKLYAGSPAVEEHFDKAGMVVLGCNIHDQMLAFVAVVDSPYYAKIPAPGHGEVNLPPGRYRLRVWHPRLNAAVEARQITVGPDPMTLPLSIAPDATQPSDSTWID
jgi:plastocyanin